MNKEEKILREMIRKEIKSIIAEKWGKQDTYDLHSLDEAQVKEIFDWMDSNGYKYNYNEEKKRVAIYDVSEASNKAQDKFLEMLGNYQVRR